MFDFTLLYVSLLTIQQNDVEYVKKETEKVAAHDKRLQLEVSILESNKDEILNKLQCSQRAVKVRFLNLLLFGYFVTLNSFFSYL